MPEPADVELSPPEPREDSLTVNLKAKAEVVLGRLGLSPTEAIALFYEQIVRERSVSFAVAMPNATTRLAIRDAEVGRKLIRARSAVALIAALDSDD